MKKKIGIGIIIAFIIFLVFSICVVIRWYKANKSYREYQYDYVEKMGTAAELDNVQYFVARDKENILTVKDNLVFGYLMSDTYRYNLTDLSFSYGHQIYRFLDPSSGEIAVSMDASKYTKWRNDSRWGDVKPLYDGDRLMLGAKYLDDDFYKLNDKYLYYYFDNDSLTETPTYGIWHEQWLKYAEESQVTATKKGEAQYIMTFESFLTANDLFNKISYIDSRITYDGYIYILKLSEIPDNNPYFDKEFPGVKEIKNDYPEGYILFRVPFDIEPEILVPLLTDDGREVTYEGIEMPAKDCKDGEDHCVNSKEDFFNYCGEGYWVRGYNVDEWSDAY